MNWLNIPISIIRTPQYVGSEPVPRATWLNLLAYCAELENGGRIAGARSWKDRTWQQTCGVTLAEVSEECDLWAWDGDDLIIWGYPEDKQQEVQQRREAGRKGGKARTEAKAEAARANGSKHKPSGTEAPPEAEPKQEPSTNPTEEKGREEKRKEGEGNEREDAPEPPLSTLFDASKLPEPPPEMPPGLPVLRRDKTPIQNLQSHLAELWPAAAKAMTGQEMHDLYGSLAVLNELTDEDWTACGAWNIAPLRELGREKRWPRDRAEFVRNAGQALELVRTWWKQGGRRWHGRSRRQGSPTAPPPKPSEPAPPEGDAGALAEFLKEKL